MIFRVLKESELELSFCVVNVLVIEESDFKKKTLRNNFN